MISVIDYGAGNLRSVANAFEAINQQPHITTDPADLAKADAIVLPGVGAFGDGMKILRQMHMVEALNEQVLVKRKPFLGICLGLQFLANTSAENGSHEGLGWLDGSVERIQPEDENTFRVPHIGWNDVQFLRNSVLFEALDEDPVFYFVHSYHLVLNNGAESALTGVCWHGARVTASVESDNIYAVQFHPEKSQRNGLTVLENFVKII